MRELIVAVVCCTVVALGVQVAPADFAPAPVNLAYVDSAVGLHRSADLGPAPVNLVPAPRYLADSLDQFKVAGGVFPTAVAPRTEFWDWVKGIAVFAGFWCMEERWGC